MKQLFLRIVSLLFTCAVVPSSLSAQSDTTNVVNPAPTLFSNALKIGVFGGVNWNYHAANFTAIEGFRFTRATVLQGASNLTRTLPDTTFSSVFSLTPAFGLAFESLFSPVFGIGARLSFASHNATFRVRENSQPVFPPMSGTDDPDPVNVSTDRVYSTALSSIALEPLFMLTPFGMGLKIYAGGRFGYMLTQSVEQQHILNNRGITSVTIESPTVSSRSGTIPNADPLSLAVSAGIGYDIPLDFIKLNETGQDKLILAPEVFGMWGLNQVAPTIGLNGTQGAWNLHQVRAGIALFYRHEEIAQRLEELRRVDTIEVYKKAPIRIPFMVGISQFVRDTVMTVEKGIKTRVIRESLLRTDTVFTTPPPRMDVSVTAVGVEANGSEKSLVQVRFEEFWVQPHVPLLNYVFFDDQAFALPPRYKRLKSEETLSFDIDKLYRSGTLDIYYHLLNIVGRRMREHPEAILTITGCNADLGGEANNGALSEQRAETVRRYFADVWGFPSNRLVLKARNLSEQPSLPKTEADKIEENRRVELTSNVDAILAPVVLSDTVRTSNPPLIRFRPRAKTDKPVTDWTLLVNYHDQEIKRFSSDSMKTELPKTLDWSLVQEHDSLLRIAGPFQYILTAQDAVGNSGVGFGTIPIEQLTLRKKRKEYRNDREFEQFSLILFQFNRAEIGEQNQHIIDFMKKRMKSGSKLSIAGYTDRTGDAAYNRNLSKQRASELARLLGVPASTAQGFGEDQLLYDNNLPEGRYYCRTVNVSIETPVRYE